MKKTRPTRTTNLKLCTDSETLGRFTNSSILHSPIHTNRGLSTSSPLLSSSTIYLTKIEKEIEQKSSNLCLHPTVCWTVEQFIFFTTISILDDVESWIRQNGRAKEEAERLLVRASRRSRSLQRIQERSTGWCVRVWPIASKLEIVPVNKLNASRWLGGGRAKSRLKPRTWKRGRGNLRIFGGKKKETWLSCAIC